MMNVMPQMRAWLRALVGVCRMVAAIGATGAFGAVEGTVRTSAPPWLSLFGVTIKADGSIYIVGSKALLLISTGHGKTWLQRTLPGGTGSPLFQYRDVYTIRVTADGKTSWGFWYAGRILHTTDCWKTWSRHATDV